ncbi:MAG: sensor histidine kinase, partial [Blastocatellia bacterium]
MRFKTMATITAVIFILAGFGFAFQDMSLARLFGSSLRLSLPAPQAPADRLRVVMMFAGLRSFIYMFGAALFGCGLLTWAIRNLKDATTQTNASLALFGLNVVAGGMALTQQLSIWKSKAGWITAGVFFAQAIGYCWLLVMKPKASTAPLAAAAEPGTQILREQWVQQIHEAAAQQERNRLARELHDSIKQQLFSINVNAATAQARWENDESGAKAALEAVRSSVREAMAEMEAMLHNLRPAPLENVGLVEAIRQQCESLQYRTGAHVTAEIGELPANQELPTGAQDAIFRIVQEALANIARHARAANVRVRLHRQTRGDEDALWLKIVDDGSGFDVSNAATGMGLANIRSRVLEIGGSLQLESREGEGTSLTLHLPLAATESREVRRELRIAFVFTLVGFLLAGSWILDHTGAYWPLAGLSVFALSGLLCFRAARSIRQMKAADAAPPGQILELQSQLRQIAALLIGSLMWSLENWHIIAETWRVYIPNETLFLTLWPLLTAYAVFRVHQSLRAQAKSLNAGEFLTSLNLWWKRVSVFLAVALSFLYARPGILAYPVLRQILIWRGYGPRLHPLNFQPIRAFWLATLV